MAKLPVVAAIPNFNMADSLRRLLPQVLDQGYDRILVLDDASTDASAQVVNDFGARVEFVRSPRNCGASANRNQIIERVDDEALIHFMDADMDLATEDIPSVARELFALYADRNVGAIGGLVSRTDGSQEPFNYGPVFSLPTILASFPPLMDRFRDKPRVARKLRHLPMPGVNDWPNVFEPAKPTEAYWVAEGNMVIHSGVFRSVGGYDPLLRSHEAQDLAIRLAKRGIRRQFDPSIEVVHHSVDVRGRDRSRQQRAAAMYLIRKHGLVRFLTDH